MSSNPISLLKGNVETERDEVETQGSKTAKWPEGDIKPGIPRMAGEHPKLKRHGNTFPRSI